jgi:Siphovirus ReqiPepy6 Gp37-like protein
VDIYILDSLYRRSLLVDKYSSFIWTERLSSLGDFELILQSTRENRTRFKTGVRLGIRDSFRVMVVKTVEDSIDAEGHFSLKVTGLSLEEILNDRVARGVLSDLTTDPKWVLTGTPDAIAKQIFHDICVTGVLDAGDIITGVNEGSMLFPTDTISPPIDEITIELEPTTVYQAEHDLCGLYSMGFRLVKDGDTSQLYFDIYTGSDRTTQQTSLPAVVFSPNLDNLQNTSELSSNAIYSNVAYVISPVGHEVVYPLDIDPGITGFERRVLLVKADDIKDEDSGVASAKMIQRGMEELAKHRLYAAFDGELNQNSQYKYGIHYNLGDLIEVRNTDGVTNVMQVTEQIFVSDNNGDRSYPTLSLNTFITAGSWLARPFSQVWLDLDDDPSYWADLP